MGKESVIILLAILGSHFYCGYLQGKPYSSIKRFLLGLAYGVFAVLAFFIASVQMNGLDNALLLLNKPSILFGTPIFILVSGLYCCKPEI